MDPHYPDSMHKLLGTHGKKWMCKYTQFCRLPMCSQMSATYGHSGQISHRHEHIHMQQSPLASDSWGIWGDRDNSPFRGTALLSQDHRLLSPTKAKHFLFGPKIPRPLSLLGSWSEQGGI